MDLESFRYTGVGWSIPQLPKLDSRSTLVLAFGASSYADRHAPLRILAETYPRSMIMGCSTAGEIHGGEVYDGSLSVAVLRFDQTRLDVAYAPMRANDYAAGQGLARALAAPDLRGVLVFADGLGVNGSQLVRGLNDHLNPTVTVTGALAADGERFERTWVLYNGLPRQKLIAAIGISGERVHIGHGTRGGWDIFGPERVITRSEGNVLYELNGQPALRLYRDYLGELADRLPAAALRFPLALRASGGSDERVVRTVLSIDEEKGSMSFAGDLPQGFLAQFMRANVDRLIDGAADAGHSAACALGDQDDILTLAISDVGRRQVLGERSEDEVEAVLDAMPKSAQQTGLYAYGTFAPGADGFSHLYNQTMTVTTIAEL